MLPTVVFHWHRVVVVVMVAALVEEATLVEDATLLEEATVVVVVVVVVMQDEYSQSASPSFSQVPSPT